MTRDEHRRAAVAALLALPDPPELTRGRRYTQPGDDRKRERLKYELERAYVRWRLLAAGRVETTIVSVRRLRLVQRRSA